MIAGRLVNLFRSGLFWVAVAAAGTAAGCHDHLYDFGVGVIPLDASVVTDGAARTDGHVGTVDAHPGGSGGHAGAAGGAGGQGGTGTGGGGTGGIQLCNPNSPDLQTDVANCGTCFHQCIVPNATPSCVKGACQFTCEAGFFDADNDPANGCECTKTNGGIEICDGLDNDCNGIVDDGFDFMTDVNNCGGCNRQCAFPFATASCVEGVCTQGACLPDFYDRDPNIPGCETECIMTNGGVEICDGLDNDCDGVVDDNLQPATITCLTQGVCAGIHPTCQGQNGWSCVYPTTYEAVEDTALGCDGLDNDCNGQTDEAFLIGKPCIFGTGPCAGTGTWVCDNSQPGDHRCMGTTKPPSPEVCDGIDNDCDGLVDEIDSLSNRTTDDLLVYVPSVKVTMYGYEASRYDATATSNGFDSTRRACSVPGKLPWSNVTMAEAEATCALAGPSWRVCTATEWQAACQGVNVTTFPYGNTYLPADCNGNDYSKGDAGTAAPIPTGKDSATCASVISTTASTGFSINPSLNYSIFDMSGNVKEWTATDLTSTKPLSNPQCTTVPCLFEMRGGAYDISSFTVTSGTTTTTSAPGLQCNSSVPAPYATITGDGGTTTQGIDVRLPSVGFRCCLPGTLPP
jgi:Sulfatase-modifying factor enzyme 1/Putative metal-binding motif